MSLVGEAPVPLYISQTIGRRHVVVAGGGGASKTGIKNGIFFYEIKNKEGKVTFEEIKFFSTDDYAPMCGYVRAQSLEQFLLAVPKDDACVNVKLAAYCFEKHIDANHVHNSSCTANGKVSFKLSDIACCKTDFVDTVAGARNQEYIKTVAIAPTRDYLAIGTTDGVLTVFKISESGLKKLGSTRAHVGEIVDLDFHPTDRQIATITRDSCGHVWSFDDKSFLKKVHTFQWSTFGDNKYRFRSCRYGVSADQNSTVFLYVAAVPRVLDKVSCSYLLRWDPKRNFSLVKSTKRVDEITALTLSDDGLFVAIGTKGGVVDIFTAFNLARVYHKDDAHSIFVTSLVFLPTCWPETANLLNGAEIGLVSVSADRQIVLHTVLPRKSFNILWTLSGAICLVYLFFWSLVYFRI